MIKHDKQTIEGKELIVPRSIRIHTKVSAEEYVLISDFCRQFGFRSVYALLQALLVSFVRYAKYKAGQLEEENCRNYGIGKEVEEMFDLFMDPEERETNKSFTTYSNRRKIY